MAEKNETRQPTHRAYSVIRREGQDDFWLNLGLVFEHKDGKGFNIVLQAFPLDGKIVCREVADDEANPWWEPGNRTPQLKPHRSFIQAERCPLCAIATSGCISRHNWSRTSVPGCRSLSRIGSSSN